MLFGVSIVIGRYVWWRERWFGLWMKWVFNNDQNAIPKTFINVI